MRVQTLASIRIGKHDPLFVVMTVAQLALEESVEGLQAKLGSIIAEFQLNVVQSNGVPAKCWHRN